MRKIAVFLFILCLTLQGLAQEKIYTKKVRLADFSEKMTRVVISGDSVSRALQEEMTLRWVFSAFEFCDEKDYEEQKNSADFSFLRTESRDGLLWLTLSKGGEEKAANALAEGFVILSFPIAPSEGPYSEAVQYMGGYVDMMQRFISDACVSDRVAYLGLDAYRKSPGGKKTRLEGEKATEAFRNGREDAVAIIRVEPSNPGKNSYVWNYTIGTDLSHYPYKVSRSKWKKR